SGRAAARRAEPGSTFSAEKTPGRVTKPGAGEMSAARQSSKDAPASKRKILPCALATGAETAVRARRSFSIGSMPSVFCPSIQTGPPAATRRAASATAARAAARDRGRNTTAAAKSPAAAARSGTTVQPWAASVSWSGRNACTTTVRSFGRSDRPGPPPMTRTRPAAGSASAAMSARASLGFVIGIGAVPLFLFHRALQRVLVAAREVHHLRHLRLGHLEGKDTDDGKPLLVHGQHDLERLRVGHSEEPFEHMDDELHRRVVVVQEKHLVERRALRLRPRLGDDRGLVLTALLAVRQCDGARRQGLPPRGIRGQGV